MHFSTLIKGISILAFAARGSQAICLNQDYASTLAKNFGLLVSNYNDALANETLTPSFTDYSESINSLINNGLTGPKSLLGLTFTSRADFEAQSEQQPNVPFKVTNTWFTCDTITVRWLSAQTPQPVVGISVLKTVVYAGSKTLPFQVQEIWAEFDSAAWLANIDAAS